MSTDSTQPTDAAMPGEDASFAAESKTHGKRKRRDASYYIDGIRSGNRTALAQAITMVESNAEPHKEIAQQIVSELLPMAGKSIRIGITGVPGVGKSTFIDFFGDMLCDLGKRVAVLAVDPSSSLTGGSILGDKTRMEKLSQREEAFIRPSPTAGNLGGVTRKSRETIVLCEAFGFDTILVETVGVGQSETTVRSMVDFFLLLLLAGAGDELQGIKKGIMELADTLVINKAEGPNRRAAEAARAEYSTALKYLSPATPGWQTEAYCTSAITGSGVTEVWEVIERFQKEVRASGFFRKRREQQRLEWMYAMCEQHLKDSFYHTPEVGGAIPEIERQVRDGGLSTSAAARDLLRLYYENFHFDEHGQLA